MKEVKNTESKPVKKTRNSKAVVTVILLLAVFGFGGYWILHNPQVLQKTSEQIAKIKQINQPALIEEEGKKAEAVEEKFVDKIKAEESQLFNNLKKATEEKASQQEVSVLADRINVLEQSVAKLQGVNNQNAIILTNIMILYNQATIGTPFVGEEEVLQRIVAGNAKYEAEANKILQLAQKGILTDLQIINEYKNISEQALEKEKENMTWWERVKA